MSLQLIYLQAKGILKLIVEIIRLMGRITLIVFPPCGPNPTPTTHPPIPSPLPGVINSTADHYANTPIISTDTLLQFSIYSDDKCTQK